MSTKFQITLGHKREITNKLRHHSDVMFEVLVDYEDRPGESLGWLTSMHDVFTGEILYWYLFGQDGDPLPGITGQYKTRKKAIVAAIGWMERFIANERSIAC